MTMPDLNSGALAPVADEVERFDFSVTGNIPRELCGTLVRNGPNPFSGRFTGSDVLSWWPEAAMLHFICHVGEVLALAEGGLPVQITDSLQTLGRSRRHTSFAGGMTAHPKIDPVTHELVPFRADWALPLGFQGKTRCQLDGGESARSAVALHN